MAAGCSIVVLAGCGGDGPDHDAAVGHAADGNPADQDAGPSERPMFDGPGGEPPVAAAIEDIEVVDEDLDLFEWVPVDASASTDDHGIEWYEWSLASGPIAEGASATTQLRLPLGTSEVTLTVRDAAGQQSRTSFTVEVLRGNSGTSYFVAPWGDDDADGLTPQTPKRTPQRVLDQIEAGDVVYFREGDDASPHFAVTDPVTVQATGSEQDWIVLRNYPGETPIFHGGDLLGGRGESNRPAGVLEVHDSAYVHLRGLHVLQSRGRGIDVFISEHVLVEECSTHLTWDSGIRVHGRAGGDPRPSRHIVVRNNEVSHPNSLDAPDAVPICENRRDHNDGCDDDDSSTFCCVQWPPHEGITMARVEDFEVVGNRVHNGGKEGIDAKGPNHRGVIRENILYDLDRVALYVDGWTAPMTDIQVIDNLVYNTRFGVAVASEGGPLVENVLVANNLFLDIHRVAMSMGSTSADGLRRDVRFVNNTIHGARYVFLLGTANVEDVVVADNLAYHIRFGARNDTQIRVDEEGLAEDAVTVGTNLVATDPRWVDPLPPLAIDEADLPALRESAAYDPEQADYGLTEGSPAIGAGDDGGDLGAIPYSR